MSSLKFSFIDIRTNFTYIHQGNPKNEIRFQYATKNAIFERMAETLSNLKPFGY
jgi:hypothetical protein